MVKRPADGFLSRQRLASVGRLWAKIGNTIHRWTTIAQSASALPSEMELEWPEIEFERPHGRECATESRSGLPPEIAGTYNPSADGKPAISFGVARSERSDGRRELRATHPFRETVESPANAQGSCAGTGVTSSSTSPRPSLRSERATRTEGCLTPGEYFVAIAIALALAIPMPTVIT